MKRFVVSMVVEADSKEDAMERADEIVFAEIRHECTINKKFYVTEHRRECACHKQIVWFFDEPTIVACEDCEMTFYHTVQTCPECGKRVSEFVKKEDYL